MVDIRIKQLFFDRPKVQRAVDAARRRVLSKAGAFIRQAAKTSIRKRKGPAPPGSPPHSHVGLLRRFILFGYDRQTDSVVVGPVGFARSNVPHLLEFGGRVRTRTSRLIPVGEIRRDKRGPFKARKRVRVPAGTTLVYEPRPFMGPALTRELPKFHELWHNSIRAG